MQKPAARYDVPAELERLMQRSMHDGVPVWCDCCSCEAEPYWSESAEEGGAAIKSKPVAPAAAERE